MRRSIVAISLAGILGALCAYGVFAFFQNTYDGHIVQEEGVLPPLPCSLNKQQCFVDFDGKRIGFEASPRPISFMEPTLINVSGLDGYDDIKLRIYGLNMEMGTLIASTTKEGEIHRAKVALNSCLLETMRYRISVYNGNEALGLYMDFDLER
ncbi:hypothetical protein [uncultured Helicobacter sp.]|uniref:hypothetical protein n=1 Tax=uncultured Helicobacter sp. TaxID=175537 RepID=UPI001C3BD110|nr:hypothetical protein [Candidatus Helicobacter avicola]